MDDNAPKAPKAAQDMTDRELVAAIAAEPVDDTERETAISSLRWACEDDDYDLMTRLAGDLSGPELGDWMTVL